MAAWDKNGSGMWPSWEDNKVFTVLLAIFLVYLIVLSGAFVQKTLRESRFVGFAPLSAPTITVSATGEASAIPDIATVDLGISVTASSANVAQDQNTEKMNELIAAIKEFGIAETDLKTSSYSLYPQYDYDVSPAVIVGYQAVQSLTVKIRDNEIIGRVLEAAGNNGVTDVGSLRYEIDDDSAIAAEARQEAIAEARKQAQDIASAMGARLGDVVDYSEYQNSDDDIYLRSYAEIAADSAAPDIQVGENEVAMTISVTYAIIQ